MKYQDLNEMQQQVQEFHEKFNMPVGGRPHLINPERQFLREDLIREEFAEFVLAAGRKDLVEVADALGDLLYVVFGAAIEYGIDMKPVVDEIHFSNLSKLGLDGNPIYREDGKVLKGPNYFPPNIRQVLVVQEEDN